ncbi:MAG: NAD-dependent epimerase/dehydratase family protein [Clostridia bacterium]|nr:NAD-dependent epimerase/dehydratase family protein [Clostridia bacterium]
MKRILITGANSYIGTSFKAYLSKNYPSEYTVDIIDMINETWREKNFAEYDSVFHVAGIVHQKETKENAELYYRVNRDLAIETAVKAKNDGVKHFILMSSMSVYGMNTGVINKDTIPNPRSNYGKSKLQAEEEILKLKDDNFLITIVRPPMVYGLGCRGNFNSVVKLTVKLPVFPKIKNQRSMIHIDNLSEFLRFAVDLELQGIYTPQNREYICTCDMAKWISEARGKKLYMSSILGFIIKLLIPFINIAQKGFGNLIYHRELENFDFTYCVTRSEESVKNSIIKQEENVCER